MFVAIKKARYCQGSVHFQVYSKNKLCVKRELWKEPKFYENQFSIQIDWRLILAQFSLVEKVASMAQWLEERANDRKVVGSRLLKSDTKSSQEKPEDESGTLKLKKWQIQTKLKIDNMVCAKYVWFSHH